MRRARIRTSPARAAPTAPTGWQWVPTAYGFALAPVPPPVASAPAPTPPPRVQHRTASPAVTTALLLIGACDESPELLGLGFALECVHAGASSLPEALRTSLTTPIAERIQRCLADLQWYAAARRMLADRIVDYVAAAFLRACMRVVPSARPEEPLGDPAWVAAVRAAMEEHLQLDELADAVLGGVKLPEAATAPAPPAPMRATPVPTPPAPVRVAPVPTPTEPAAKD